MQEKNSSQGAALRGIGPAVRQAGFCAENYICSQGNQQKLLPPELHFLNSNMHQIVCPLVLSPRSN